ncbi:MAG: tetratricopeptide repeat protein [Acidobacteriota bacterium]|nr:tetratricopeptide repeat protein [Acidobacteriota bacterium]
MNGKRWPMALAVAIFAVCLPSTALAQRPTNPVPGVMEPTGSITVSIRDEQGTPISIPSSVSVATARGGPMIEAQSQKGGEEWVFSNLTPGMQYVVKVETPGFATVQQYVELPFVNNPSVRVDFYLVPKDRENEKAKPAGGAILAPRAQKEVQQGIKDLEAKKISSAQKHLAKALKMAPGNPLVNYLMGECSLRAGKVDEAIRYLENSLSLDPKQTQALLALGTVRYQQGDTAKAIELLTRAVAAAPKLWEAHWLLAGAYLREGNYKKASEDAEAALKYGKERADSARLILAVAQAKLGKRNEALQTLDEYLKRHPGDRQAEKVRASVGEPQQPERGTETAARTPATGKRSQATNAPVGEDAYTAAARPPEPTSVTEVNPTPIVAATKLATPPLAAVPAKEGWMPPDIDAEKPERVSNATCHLPQILEQAAKHAEELVSNLEKFSATEDFEEVEIGRNGALRQPLTQKFSYLAFIQHIRPDLISVDEMRAPNPFERLVGVPLISTGSVALALAFHPDFSGDFDWKCEGMGEWKGEPAWMIHFEQRANRPTSRLQAFASKTSGDYALPLKGRAWVAANGNHLVHLETDLVRALEQVRLEREHFAIDFGLVRFHSQPVALWLPKSVDAYFRYEGHSYHEYSRFSNFQLFWVGTAQEFGKPKQKLQNP